MKINKGILSIVIGLFMLACGKYPITKTHQYVPIGNKKVELVLLKSGEGGIHFFNVHDNENTSVKAVMKYFKENQGTLVMLKNNGKRLVTFEVENESFKVDPNRIFTDEGAKKTLEHYHRYSASAFKEVRQFAEGVLEILNLQKDSLIVTLHNNSDNHYNMISYLPDGTSGGDAGQLYFNESLDPDDFFFVTNNSLFDIIKRKGFDVALQNNESASDDGSLSVYCGKREIPYINIEAQHGHLEEQLKMIESIQDIYLEFEEKQ